MRALQPPNEAVLAVRDVMLIEERGTDVSPPLIGWSTILLLSDWLAGCAGRSQCRAARDRFSPLRPQQFLSSLLVDLSEA